MKPIRDIGALSPSSVLYHSAFGFARVLEVEAGSVRLQWEEEGDNLPGRVAHDIISRVYAVCSRGGFFERALNDRDGLVELMAGQPIEGLALLLDDLNGAQNRSDLVDWITGRGVMTADAAKRWWETVRAVIEEDPRFVLDQDRVRLAREDDDSGPLSRLKNPALAPARRLDIALNHRDALGDGFLEQLVLAWKTGSSAVRDLALKAARDLSVDAVLSEMLGGPPDGIEAVIHAIRRGGWGPEDLSATSHTRLLDRVIKGCDAGGPLDNEGRLAATLARWESPGIVETLGDLASSSDGKRLVRATLAALPPRRAEVLAVDLLESALESEAVDAANWLTGELLGIALVDQDRMADRLEDDHPELAEWMRDTYQGIEERGLAYDDSTDEATAHTAELDLSEVVDGPIPLSRLPPRSGASLLGLGLAISRALAVHHKDGVVCNPSADRVLVLPSETMQVTASEDPTDCPLPAGEGPSTAADVYAAAVLLLQTLLARPWPTAIPAQRVVPYLRYVVPLLPPAAMAPLDAALHPDPALRPKDGLAWQALWQVAAVAEEKRSYAQRDPAARLHIGYDSHIGRTKLLLTQTNQDALFVSAKGPLSLMVVCDGISTANAGSGDVASSIASHVIANLWDQALPRLVQAGPAEIREFLDRALRMANQAVCEAALRFAGGNLDGRVPMGTTAIVALVYGNRVWLAWLGDSRAYLVGPYGASLLTFDENQASERLRAWHLNFIDHWDPAGYALVGYLGHFDEMSRAEALPAHHTSFTLVPGERLMLCSDGVTDYLGDTHPEAALYVADAVREDDPYEAARYLVDQANRGGGGDNITTIVARLWEE